MVKGKQKFALLLTPDGIEKVQSHFRSDGCKSQREFIERAIQFYCMYLNSDKSGDYLPNAISSTLEAILVQFGDRLGKLLFKQAVELSMMSRILAADSELDKVTLERLRDRCVQDVKRTNGQLSFRDVMRFNDKEL
jgi:hypothetical protein